MQPNDQPRSTVEVTISWATLLKLFIACLIAYLAIRLLPFIELLLVALLIAITLWPLLNWTSRHGWPRWGSIMLCALLLLGSVLVLVGLLVPTVVTQGATFISSLPAFKKEWFERLPSSGIIRQAADRLLSSPMFSNPEPLLKQFVAWGTIAVTALVEFFVMLILAIYFLVDGQRVYQWLLAFLPERHRKKMAAASPEIASVVGHYMAGQLITSVLCGGYAFLVLTILHVPSAALLGVLAGLFDLLPMIGFFFFTIPSMIVALTVSPLTAAIVGLLFAAYHIVENYYIVPKVYGERLRLSTLTVLVACIAAGLVTGIPGVIIVLPIIASYPIVERIWLTPYLQRDTSTRHSAIDSKAADR